MTLMNENPLLHKTEATEKAQFSSIPSISVPSGRFPRAVREPPRRKLLRGLTWTRFSRRSRRSALQSALQSAKSVGNVSSIPLLNIQDPKITFEEMFHH